MLPDQNFPGGGRENRNWGGGQSGGGTTQASGSNWPERNWYTDIVNSAYS